jgi:hypothetical protein
MAMTRSRRRRHKVARTLVSSLISSSAARTRARVVRIGICLLVAGSQTAQFGVGPVDQGAAFADQVFAVVEQGAQIRGGADGEPDWR